MLYRKTCGQIWSGWFRESLAMWENHIMTNRKMQTEDILGIFSVHHHEPNELDGKTPCLWVQTCMTPCKHKDTSTCTGMCAHAQGSPQTQGGQRRLKLIYGAKEQNVTLIILWMRGKALSSSSTPNIRRPSLSSDQNLHSVLTELNKLLNLK